MRRLRAVGVAPAALAIVVAGCGGGSQSGTTSAGGYGAARPAPKTAAATVATARTEVGPTLVDAQGRAGYSETQGASRVCTPA